MERRTFLINSSKLSMSVAASSMLLGCGGGGSSSNVQSLSEIDTKLVSLDTEQGKITDSHLRIQNNLNFGDPSLESFYTKVFPGITSESLDPILSDNYLTHFDNDKNLWQNAKIAHDIAYQQYQHQYTKMKAAFRLFDYKQVSTYDVNSSQAKSISLDAVKAKVISADNAMTVFSTQLKSLPVQSFSISETSTIDALIASLSAIFETLNSYIVGDNIDAALDYAATTYLLIEELLIWIKNQALSNLNFTTPSEILISLAKLTIAILSILGLATLRNLDLSTTVLTSEQNKIYTFLSKNTLESKVSSVWMDISNKTALSTIDELKKNVRLSIETNEIPDNTELINEMKNKSQILTITAVVMKEVLASLQQDIGDNSDTSFSEGSTANDFKILFGSDKNPYDQALNNMMEDKKSTFATTDPTLSGNLDKTFRITISENTTTIENDAYLFATELANLAFTFASQTTTQAVEFATHLADLAYAFTMDIEEDAYQFALQGMEWGYLFASRGEEVGLMADRILWMAVQIGVMADRIGEMADRIVYTEQLIVYTEILILDFGILIYGFGSQITNLILTGMALIFDREWYTPDANNVILDTINNNVMIMLSNMQEYALAVLEHQTELRELTLAALDSLPYAQPESV